MLQPNCNQRSLEWLLGKSSNIVLSIKIVNDLLSGSRISNFFDGSPNMHLPTVSQPLQESILPMTTYEKYLLDSDSYCD